MVDTSRLHTYKKLRFELGDEEMQGKKILRIHLQDFISDEEGTIFKSKGEAILGDIDTHEIRELHNCITSLERIRGHSAPKLNLLLKLSLKSSINLFEPQRAEDTLFLKPESSGKTVFCLLGLIL